MQFAWIQSAFTVMNNFASIKFAMKFGLIHFPEWLMWLSYFRSCTQHRYKLSASKNRNVEQHWPVTLWLSVFFLHVVVLSLFFLLFAVSLFLESSRKLTCVGRIYISSGILQISSDWEVRMAQASQIKTKKNPKGFSEPKNISRPKLNHTKSHAKFFKP